MQEENTLVHHPIPRLDHFFGFICHFRKVFCSCRRLGGICSASCDELPKRRPLQKIQGSPEILNEPKKRKELDLT